MKSLVLQIVCLVALAVTIAAAAPRHPRVADGDPLPQCDPIVGCPQGPNQ